MQFLFSRGLLAAGQILKEEVQPELNQPRVHASVTDHAINWRCDVLEADAAKTAGAGVGELRVVKRIVEVAPELHPDPLRDLRVLHNREVPVELAGSSHYADTRIAIIGSSWAAKRHQRRRAPEDASFEVTIQVLSRAAGTLDIRVPESGAKLGG